MSNVSAVTARELLAHGIAKDGTLGRFAHRYAYRWHLSMDGAYGTLRRIERGIGASVHEETLRRLRVLAEELEKERGESPGKETR